MYHFATAEHEKEKLKEFSSPEGQDDLRIYCNRERRNSLEVLYDFHSVKLPLDYLIDVIPKIQPRSFSISSSLSMHSNQIHITIAVVKYKTPLKREIIGLCSTWLASLRPGDKVPIWVTPGSMKLPPVDVPLILVGPGTGIAPFMSFLQKRKIQKNCGNIGEIITVFGCRHKSKDFLYEAELINYKNEGVITHLWVAFSRDQNEKVYVQHKLLEDSAIVWDYIHNKNASIFISGSANRMPQDVRLAFKDIIKI